MGLLSRPILGHQSYPDTQAFQHSNIAILHSHKDRSEVFHIRPFRPEDEEECYRVCLQTWDDGMDASQDFASHPTLVGEKSIGPLLTFYPGLGFVFENNEGQIVGYIFIVWLAINIVVHGYYLFRNSIHGLKLELRKKYNMTIDWPP